MLGEDRVVVVMPAYNAAHTLRQTVEAIDRTVTDEIILVDDSSGDTTAELAREMGLTVHVHAENRGYGGNQKSCYRIALERGADIVVMVHADYQYDPRLVPAMAGMVHSRIYDVVLGSRILGGGAVRGGMPRVRYVANRFLTAFQNVFTRAKLSEYHTGYRAFSRPVLERLPLDRTSDDFIFDNQILCQALALGFRLGEISCPTRYFPEASSINMTRATIYGLGVLKTSVEFWLHQKGVVESELFKR